MCCEPLGNEDLYEGDTCPACEANVDVNMRSITICGYSPVQCEVCEDAPCDLSC